MLRRFFPPRLLLVLLALLAAAPLRAGTTTETVRLEMDGLPREFLLTIPDGLDGPVPLVLAVHGLLEEAKSMRERVAIGRLDAAAEQYGFVVAYPSAFGRVWNRGEGLGAERLIPQRDDVAFLREVIEIVRDRVEIAPDRIFAAGYSQGGLMSIALACKTPGLIRAVASVAMSMPEALAEDCARHPPDGIVFIHGTKDWVVPFEGGLVASGPGASMPLMSHARSVDFFRRIKGCAGPGDLQTWDSQDDGTKVVRTSWYDCDKGAVEGYRVDGMGHRWPSGGPLSVTTLVIGPTTREIDGTSAVWGFFSRFQ